MQCPQDEYAERLQFEDEDAEALLPAAKRRRTETVDTSDGVLDAETAWAIGFTPQAVTTEEESLLPVRADEDVYTKVPFQTPCSMTLVCWRRRCEGTGGQMRASCLYPLLSCS